MCNTKDTPQERSFFQNLRDKLTTSLNSALADYNALRPHIDKLALQNEAYRGAPVEGASSMFMNRVNGAYALYRSPMAFYEAGLSGFHWAYFFSSNKDLNKDVYNAGMATLYSHLWPLSFRGIATVAVTGYDASQGGAKELKEQAMIRYEQQRNALGVSMALSVGVTQLFTQVGKVVQTDTQRLIVQGAKRSWQVTGLLGFCYGLSRLHESMKETGVFGEHLRQRRDEFVNGTPPSVQRELDTTMQDSVVSHKV